MGAPDRQTHGGDRVVECLGDLLRRPAEDVAQDQYGPLLGWQELDRGDECELDGLAHDEVFEQPIGIWLQMFEVLGQLSGPRASSRDRGEADVRGYGV
jgi:hypothetical protein